MGTYTEDKRDMDDSGCIQDSSPTKPQQPEAEEYTGSAHLLDLSDDVLLYILVHLSPRDLKALGFTCSRLGTLISDRSLWHRVDLRNERVGRAHVRWYLTHVLHEGTRELHLRGLAHLSQGCNGHSNRTRAEVEAEEENQRKSDLLNDDSIAVESSEDSNWRIGHEGRRDAEPPYPLFRQHARMHINAHQLPRSLDRFSGAPTWPQDSEDEDLDGPRRSRRKSSKTHKPKSSKRNSDGAGINSDGAGKNSDGSGKNSDGTGKSSDGSGIKSDRPGVNSDGVDKNLDEAGNSGNSDLNSSGESKYLSETDNSRKDLNSSEEDKDLSEMANSSKSDLNLNGEGSSLSETEKNSMDIDNSSTQDLNSNGEVKKSTEAGSSSKLDPNTSEEGKNSIEMGKNSTDLSNSNGEGINSDGKGINSDEKVKNSDGEGKNSEIKGKIPSIKCPGPQFTFTKKLLKHLQSVCPAITELSLEYCNINCRTVNMSNLPPTLKKLSLRGTRCYNLPLDKSYLFKIHDYLPKIEVLDVSECGWLEPASLLPLSKLPELHTLRASHCYGLGECVAYASLATRYGFTKLKVLDLRGSPVGDSEVSALGWIPCLEELYLCPAPKDAVESAARRDHTHYRGDYATEFSELERWEIEEPEYFKLKTVLTDSDSSVSDEDIEGQIAELQRMQWENQQRPNPEDPSTSNRDPQKRKPDDDEPGPSKKRKPITNGGTLQSLDGRRQININNVPNLGVMDDDGNINILFTRESFDANNDSNERQRGAIVHAFRSGRNISVRVENDSDRDDNRDGNQDYNDEPRRTVKRRAENTEDQQQQPGPPKCCHFGYRRYFARYDITENRAENRENVSANREDRGEGSGDLSANRDNGSADRGNGSANKDIGSADRGNSTAQDKDKSGDNSSDDSDDEAKPGTSKDGQDNNDKRDDKDNKDDKKQDDDNDNGGRVRIVRNEIEIPLRPLRDTRSGERPVARLKFANHPLLSENFEMPVPLRIQHYNQNIPRPQVENLNGENLHREGQIPNENPENQAQNQENPAQNAENLAQNAEIPAQNAEIPARNAENPAQTPENVENQPGPSRNQENPAQNAENAENQPGPSRNQENLAQNQQNAENQPGPSRNQENVGPNIQFMRFPGSCTVNLQDQQPVVIQCSMAPQERREPRQHVLYVNLGRPQSNVFRLMHNAVREPVPNIHGNNAHIESTALVSDAAVRRFGRADGEDIVVHIGPNGPFAGNRPEVGGRPNRSTLRVLSVTGYRNITDRSLVHLVTAAPNLQRIDFSRTNVTEQGVENFKALRPDCEVTYSKFEDQT